MKRFLIMRSVALSYAFLLAALSAQALAQEKAEENVRDMVEKVLRKTKTSPHPDLNDWSRLVLERALERAGKNATETSAPLPAESRAGSLAGEFSAPRRGAEVIVFMSLSVPAAGWREWSLEATRIGAPLVLRGVTRGGLRATLKRIGTHLAEGGGTAIDPHMFRLFGIDAVPAVAVVPGGVPPCSRRGCSGDMPPPHDLVKGNVGLDAALRIVAAEGGPGRETARLHLEKLGGEHE